MKGEKHVFKNKMIKEGKQNADEDVLGESKGCRQQTKEIWWWNTEVQATSRLKRVFFFFLMSWNLTKPPR